MTSKATVQVQNGNVVVVEIPDGLRFNSKVTTLSKGGYTVEATVLGGKTIEEQVQAQEELIYRLRRIFPAPDNGHES